LKIFILLFIISFINKLLFNNEKKVKVRNIKRNKNIDLKILLKKKKK